MHSAVNRETAGSNPVYSANLTYILGIVMNIIFMLFMSPILVVKHWLGILKMSSAANGTGMGDAVGLGICYLVTVNITNLNFKL